MLLALQPPTPMQHDIKPSPHLNHIHEYSTSAQSQYKSVINSSLSRYSPPESPRHLPSLYANGVSVGADSAMSGSSGHGHSHSQYHPPSSLHHRGLPPPTGSGFALPPPTPSSQDPQHRSASAAPPQSHGAQQPQSTGSVSLGQLPAPPTTWSSTVAPSDEAMRSWLHAKAEEDRRRQEEERTTQEKVRLEQRRLERDMLRESLDRGIPPAMVPLIFAGLGSQGSGAGVTQAIEFAQNYMQGLSLQQQQAQQPLLSSEQQQRLAYEQQLRLQGLSSPDIRREREREREQQGGIRDRMIPPNPYGSQPPQPQTLASHSQRSSSFSSGAAPPPPPGGALSKLNTVDFAPPQSTTASSARQGLHPSLSSNNLTGTFARDAEAPSQSTGQSNSSGAGGNSGVGLFFHHWTPPTGSSNTTGQSGQPATPSGKSMQGSPYGSQGSNTGTHGHLRKQQGPSQPQSQAPNTSSASNIEWAENSPKKRKMNHPVSHSGGSGSSGGSASRAHSGMSSVQTPAHAGAVGTGSAIGAALTSTPVSMIAPGSGLGQEGEGGDAESERERERDREPLRPSSRQQRLEERQPQGHASYYGPQSRGYDERDRDRERDREGEREREHRG